MPTEPRGLGGFIAALRDTPERWKPLISKIVKTATLRDSSNLVLTMQDGTEALINLEGD